MGAKPISDKKRKKIIADYLEEPSYRAVARKNKVSDYSVRKIVGEAPGITQQLAQKKEENTQSVLEYMDSLSDLKKEILRDMLVGMKKKAKDLDMFTNIRDIATAYGIVLDKEVKFAEMKFLSAGNHQSAEVDELSKSLMELAGDLDGG